MTAGQCVRICQQYPVRLEHREPQPHTDEPGPGGGRRRRAVGAPSATPSATAAAVDKTQPVTIYNATTTAGLATRVGGTVTSDGWVLGETGNWGVSRNRRR